MELLGTTSVTVRLPNPVVKFIDESDYANRSEFLRHWANVGWRVGRDPELTEALDWALDRSVQDETAEADSTDKGKNDNDAGDSGAGEDSEWTQVYAAVEVSPETLERLPPSPDWGAIARGEVEELHESQLEALRSRVK